MGILGVLLVLFGPFLIAMETRRFRDAQADGDDFFKYSRGKWVLRTIGAIAIGVAGLALAASEWWVKDAYGAALMLWVLVASVGVVVIIGLWDLRATSKSANATEIHRQ